MATISTIYSVSTGEYLLTLDVNGKRYGAVVVPKSNISAFLAEDAHKNIVMQANTYGDKGATEMFDYYKSYGV